MNVHKKFLYWNIIAMLGSSTVSVNALADGRISITPLIKAGARYDSNFWKAEKNEAGVYTYLTQPGLKVGYETAKTNVALNTTVDVYKYDDQDTSTSGVRKAEDDDYVGFTGLLSGKTQATGRLLVGLDDSLSVTRDPAQSDPLSNSVDREKFTINRFTPNLYYDFGNKFGVRTKYRNTDTNYQDDGEDSTEHRGIFDLEYNPNRSSTVYLEYQIWNMEYDLSSTDYCSNKVTLNYLQKYKYFNIMAGGGYHKRTFDTSDLEDMDLFSWRLKVRGEGSKSRMALTLSQEMNDAGTGDEYFTATVADLEVGYTFLRKIDTSVQLILQNSDYENSGREDDTWTTKATIKYPVLDTLTLFLEGGYSSRDSNETGKNYDNTFIGLNLTFSYDLGNRL